MKKLTPTQLFCLLAILSMIALRCASGNTDKAVRLTPSDTITIERNGKIDTGLILNPIDTILTTKTFVTNAYIDSLHSELKPLLIHER